MHSQSRVAGDDPGMVTTLKGIKTMCNSVARREVRTPCSLVSRHHAACRGEQHMAL